MLRLPSLRLQPFFTPSPISPLGATMDEANRERVRMMGENYCGDEGGGVWYERV